MPLFGLVHYGRNQVFKICDIKRIQVNNSTFVENVLSDRIMSFALASRSDMYGSVSGVVSGDVGVGAVVINSVEYCLF